jgi:hypothetical protein
MRPVREITSEEARCRVEPIEGTRAGIFMCDPVEPEPVGTIVLMAFRVTGYDKDCDGSLMARLERIDSDGEPTGWEPTHIGLHQTTDLVVTPEEWRGIFDTHNATGCLLKSHCEHMAEVIETQTGDKEVFREAASNARKAMADMRPNNSITGQVPAPVGRSFDGWLNARETPSWVRSASCSPVVDAALRLAYEAGREANAKNHGLAPQGDKHE